MNRGINRLKARTVATLKPKPGRTVIRRGDGNNLWLQCTLGDNGQVSRSWLFRWRKGTGANSTEKSLGLGPTRLVSLAEAREIARQYCKLLLDGHDPAEHRLRERSAKIAAEAGAKTFEECAKDFYAQRSQQWKSRHAAQYWSSIERFALPKLGKILVSDITHVVVTDCLDAIWRKRPTTARRVRARIAEILDYAIGKGHRPQALSNPATIEMVQGGLGKQTSRRQHFPALPYDAIPDLMTELRSREGIVPLALQFTILTAARTGEVIGATWSEIEGAMWTIAANRMKASRVHRVPLSDAALAVLERAATMRSGDRIFPISDAGMAALMKRLDLKEEAEPGRVARRASVHGFRSAFRDWLSERTTFAAHLGELALAHTVGGMTVRSYARSDLAEQRRPLMAAWAQFCDGEPGGNVIQMRG